MTGPKQLFGVVRAVHIEEPTNGDAGVDYEGHSSVSSSRPARIAREISTSCKEGDIDLRRRDNATFSSTVSGAAAVRISRSSCSSDCPFNSAFTFSRETTSSSILRTRTWAMAASAIIYDSTGDRAVPTLSLK